MRLFSWLFSLGCLVAAACFAFANKAPVSLAMWPFDLAFEMPLYAPVLGALFVGLTAGAVFTWVAMVPYRYRAWRLQKEVNAMVEKEKEKDESNKPMIILPRFKKPSFLSRS